MKISKKILSLVLSAVMVVGTLTATPIFAAENVCHIGSTYYTSLEEALNAYNNKTSTQTKTIELDADCEINNNVSLKKVDYTINGNGHVICTDTTNSTSTYKARGIQTNSSAVLTINDATMTVESQAYSIFQYAGVVTCNNVTFMDSSKEAIYFNSNTNVHTLTLNGCTFTEFSTTPLLINVANADVTIKDTTFSDNTGDYDVEYTLGTSLSIGGTSTINKLELADGKTITPLSDLSLSSYIGLYLDTTIEGTQILTGSYIASKYSVFKIPSASNLSIDSNGQIKVKKVAKWNGTEYETLAAAIKALNDDTGSVKTIYLIDDAYIDTRVSITRAGVTITDDGTPRTIYVHNTDSSSAGGYGRGFQMQFSNETSSLTFKGTKSGYLTIVGHNEDETQYNASHIFAVRGGTLKLNNVIIKECVNTYSGGPEGKLGAVINCKLTTKTDETPTRGNAQLTNCEIYDCQATNGAAIYSYGGDVTLENTRITNCASVNDAGVVSINDEDGTISTELSHNGMLYLKGGVVIKDNYKNTNLEQKTSGTPSNVSVENGTQITVSANQTSASNIGIDYGKEGDIFATNGSYTGYASAFHRDGDNTLSAKKDSNGKLYWKAYAYSVNWGAYTTVSTSNIGVTTYKYPSATVTAENGTAVSVAVDNGSFEIDWSKLSISSVTSYQAVLEDGSFVSDTTLPTSTISYKGITIYGTAITSTNSANLIKTIEFTNVGSGITQNISFGMAETLETGESYFAGSKYNYISDALTWDNANLAAGNANSHLIYIGSKTENEYANGITNADVWTGAAQKLNAWYWNDGTQFSANAKTNEGYEGAFVNWAPGKPDGSGERMVLSSNGQWINKEAISEYGYLLEREDSKKVNNPVSITASVTTSLLSSMNLSFDGDVSMYYYFLLADDVKSHTDYKVVVEVGTGADKITVSSTIADMANLIDSQGNYGIKVPVPAKMMGADIKIALCNSNGDAIRAYGNIDGNHPEKNYNCLYYANYMFDKQEDRYNQYYSEDLIAMITAMLNYGAAAQQQFSYDTENLVNKGHEDTSETMENIPEEDIVDLVSTGFSSVSLIANSKTEVALEYTGSGSNPTVYIDGVQTTNFTYENKVVKIPVCAQNLGKRIEVSIGSDYAILNANYVLDQILIGSDYSTAQKLTADRLYKFGKKADTYFGIYAQNTSAIEAVLETAYAYLAKETYSQYDMYSIDSVGMASDVPQGRRQLFATPEEMTDYHMTYMDCSSFCFSVYSNVYGAEATKNALLSSSYALFGNIRTKYLTKYANTTSIVKTYTNLATDTWYTESDQSQYITNWTNAVEDAKKIMQPGDLLSYYGYKNAEDAGGGHIVMWTGSGFIHCTGSSYNTESGTDPEEENGAVHYIPVSEFNYTYLMKHGAQQATIIRPLNVLGNNDVSEDAVARTQLGSIAVEATGEDTTTSTELYQGQYVNVGDSVTYTITITNKQMIGNLTLDRTVNVEYSPSEKLGSISVQNGGKYDEATGTITWEDVTVGVNGTVTLTFSGTVTGSVGEILDGGSGTISLSDAGTKAVGLSFESEEVEIENALPSDIDEKLEYVKDNASEFLGTDGAATVNAMLQHITGDNTKSIGTDNNAVMGAIRTVTSLGNYKPLLEEYWQGNIVSNFCGGTKFFMPTIDKGPYCVNNRVRNIKVDNLKVGDIIMTYRNTKGLTDYYVYLGGDEMLSIDNNLSTETVSAATICERLIGRSLWGVFRLTK